MQGADNTSRGERTHGTRWDPADFPDLPWDVRSNRDRIMRVERALEEVVVWQRRTAWTGLLTALSAAAGLLIFILETLAGR